MDETAFQTGFRNATVNDLERVVLTALALEKKMYANEDTIIALHDLRKALEGIWGHDLP